MVHGIRLRTYFYMGIATVTARAGAYWVMMSSFLVYLIFLATLIDNSLCIPSQVCPLGQYCLEGDSCKDSTKCIDSCYKIKATYQGNGISGSCENGKLQ